MQEFDDDSEDDVEDYTIKKHDCLVVAGKIVACSLNRKTSSASSKSTSMKRKTRTCTCTTT